MIKTSMYEAELMPQVGAVLKAKKDRLIRADAFNKRVPLRAMGSSDLSALMRQLANLIDCDLPVIKCFKLLSKYTKTKKMRVIMSDLVQRMEGGIKLSDAMDSHPRQFDSSYSSMVRAGELNGQLSSVFRQIADSVEDNELRAVQKMTARYYSMLMLSIGFGVIFVTLTFLVPQIPGAFEELNGIFSLE